MSEIPGIQVFTKNPKKILVEKQGTKTFSGQEKKCVFYFPMEEYISYWHFQGAEGNFDKIFDGAPKELLDELKDIWLINMPPLVRSVYDLVNFIIVRKIYNLISRARKKKILTLLLLRNLP